MKNTLKMQFSRRTRKAAAGFSLVEMMVAVAIFLIIGGAAVSLVSKHAPLASSAQNQAGLNIALRNAIAQMEIDVSNAGTGYYTGANIAEWPVGITIVNGSQATACNTGTTYTAACFDTLNVIAVDTTTPLAHPWGATSSVSSSSATLFITPADSTSLATLAADYQKNDWVMVLSSDGSKMAVVQLTQDGKVAGSQVNLNHHGLNASAQTIWVDASGVTHNNGDPFSISDQASSTINNKLGTTFTSNDWVMKLNPITYSVDSSNAANPKLIRTQGKNQDVVAEQIIGFRVGASVREGTVDQPYNFNASGTSDLSGCTSNCGYENTWSQIRAVRISIIGRTPPNGDLTNKFHNSFDGGPYRIQGASVTINPRNLSMIDQTN